MWGAPNKKIVNVGGGFEEEDAVKCSRPNMTSERLKVSRKRRTLEGFYTVYTQMQNSLLSHVKRRMPSFIFTPGQNELQAVVDKSGTLKKSKYLPIHTICERLKETIPEVEPILSFRAITGCDTGHSKKTS